MITNPNGYCLLITGVSPSYRIIFKSNLDEALKALHELKAKSSGKVEVLKMIDGDTQIIEEEDNVHTEG